MSRQHFTPGTTTWHITWGTYGTRLHGDDRPTVDKQHNDRDTPFLGSDPARQRAAGARMAHPPVRLTREQCLFIQEQMPGICERGGWGLRVCTAAPDHVHVLLDIKPDIHGQKVRRLLKRWLTEALNEAWAPGSGRPGSLATGATWWAEEGSNKPIKDVKYLNNAFNYVHKQRMTW
jgi:REP element-mobilizing transposase RayT